MTAKILSLITILTYSMIVSQSFMYILSLKDVQLNLEANAYVELRKLINISMRSNFKYVIYAGLLSNITLLISTFKTYNSFFVVTVSIALVALIIDILLTLKGNLPINDFINSWPAGTHPKNWTEVRDQWLHIFQYRQIANIIGFISLVMGVIFRSKQM